MAMTIPRQSTRRWVISCKNGTWETYPLTRYAADEVARWCDRYHPDCKPHIVLGAKKNV